MSGQMTLPGFVSAISSPESAAGHTLSRSRAGPKTSRAGLDHAPASRLALLDEEWATLTHGTCGHTSEISSASAVLQSSLASKLRAGLDLNGSLEYRLTWKHYPIRSRQRICALRASARHKSDKDYTGWPSPLASEVRQGFQNRDNGKIGTQKSLSTIATEVAGWATPTTHDRSLPGKNHKARGGRNSDLPSMALMAGWATPKVARGKYQFGKDGKKLLNLEGQVELVGYPTPCANKHTEHVREDFSPTLAKIALMAGWPTASSRDHKGGYGGGQNEKQQTFYCDTGRHCATGFWSRFEILPFKDGKYRRVEPGTFPLVNGFSARVAILKGFGNAINPHIAATFIKAVSEIISHEK